MYRAPPVLNNPPLNQKSVSFKFTSVLSRLERRNDPRPSTSHEETKQGKEKSPGKPTRAKKTFVKFKDDKYKNQANRNLRKIAQKPSRYGVSPSQMLSRKILRTIKKKISPNSTLKQNRSLIRQTHNICDLTKKESTNTGAESRPAIHTGNNDDDDDCVLIANSPEIILIDDESTNCDSSNAENISNISNLILKSYQPIGSGAHNREQCSFQKMLHSTPKLILDANPRHSRANRYGSARHLPMILESHTNDHATKSSSNDRTNEPVVIEDTVDERLSSRKRSHEDDSVIFVSEVVKQQQVSTADDFIPLTTETEKYPISRTSHEPKQKRQRNELFTSKEQKQLQQYNENAYNPNKDDPTTVTQKRMVIVDGSNVAYQHALNKEFSVKGLKICLEYFEKLGHEVKAVVPQFRLQKLKSSDPTALEKLHEEGKIVFTPCKNLPGKLSSSYDDRFILQLAAELDAAIVSNDNYRDLIHENPAFKKIIENRVVGFSWCNDLFILPKDPYGKWGPTLSTILNRS